MKFFRKVMLTFSYRSKYGWKKAWKRAGDVVRDENSKF